MLPFQSAKTSCIRFETPSVDPTSTSKIATPAGIIGPGQGEARAASTTNVTTIHECGNPPQPKDCSDPTSTNAEKSAELSVASTKTNVGDDTGTESGTVGEHGTDDSAKVRI